MGLVLYVPFLGELFRFARLSPVDVLTCVGAGLASVLWFEIVKRVMRLRDGSLLVKQ